MHLVAFNKVVFLFVNGGRSSGEGQNIVIQIPAQIFIKHSGQEMELFIIVFLCKRSKKVEQNKDVTMAKLLYLESQSGLPCCRKLDNPKTNVYITVYIYMLLCALKFLPALLF